jgi:cation:H+ antiporter
MFDTVLILLVDLVYMGPPVLREVDPMTATATLLCIFLTGFMSIGMIERRGRTIARMGYDSLAIILAYLAGIAPIVARS